MQNYLTSTEIILTFLILNQLVPQNDHNKAIKLIKTCRKLRILQSI